MCSSYSELESKKIELTYLAFGEFFLGCFLFPSEQRRNGNETAEDPNGGDHDDATLRRSLAQILDGVSDGPVAIQTDEAKVHDARRAE